MPIRFRKLREAGGKARSAVAFIRNSLGREKCERHAGSEAGEQSPAQDSACAKRSQQRRGAQRTEHRANRIHGAFKSKRAASLFRRNAVGQQGVARWPAAAAPDPAERAHQQNRRPRLREGVSECGKPGGEISDDAGWLAQLGTIRNPTSPQFREAGNSVRDPFDHAQRECRRAQACEKRRQNRGCGFVAPIGEQAGEADAEHAAREPALRRRARRRIWRGMR